MKKRFITIAVILIILFGIFIYFYYPKIFPSANAVSQKTIIIKLSEETLPLYLSSNSMVKDLPKDALIELKTSAKTYTVQKGIAKEGASENPDITLAIPSSYIPELANGLCRTIAKANVNGDLGINVHISKAFAVWKYRSMLKYENCLG